jgi:hypothetical protein
MSDVAHAEQWKPSEHQHELLFAELGRCVLLYQSIELQLKFVLPHLVVPGIDATAPGEGFENWRVLLDSKKTLGLLVQTLAERVSSNDKSALEMALRRLVDERNEIVHHFASKSFVRLQSEAEYREAFAFLRARRQSAIPMFQMLQEFSKLFVDALQEPGDAA